MGGTAKSISAEISPENCLSTPRRRPAAQPNPSPRSVRSAPVTRTSTSRRQTTDKYPSSVTEDASHSPTHPSLSQPLTSAPSIPTLIASASSIPIVVTSASHSPILSTSAPRTIIPTSSLDFQSVLDMDLSSPQESLTFGVDAQPSGSTAQLAPAVDTIEPSTVDQPLNRWLRDPTNPTQSVPGTPQSIATTVPSASPTESGARRALHFPENPILTTPNGNAQNTPAPSVRQSVAPSHTSSNSEAYRALQERNLELERQVAAQQLRSQQQDDKIQRLEDIANQMQAHMQTAPNTVQSAAPTQPAVHIQPSITVARINPRAQTHITPVSVNNTASRVVTSIPLVQHVTTPSSTSMLHVIPPISPAFPALPAMSSAPAAPCTLSHNVPIPYAAVVQPSLIPTASIIPQPHVLSQPVVHTSVPQMLNIPTATHHVANVSHLHATSQPPVPTSVPYQQAHVSVQPSLIPVANSAQYMHVPVQPAVPLHQTIPIQPAASHVSISSTNPTQPQPALSQGISATDFAEEFVKICRQNSGANRADQAPRFKMDSAERIKTAHLRKGERLTSDLVLQWVAVARVLDSAALKARNREPETLSEWKTFFKFYIDHMEDGLYEVMMTKVAQGSFTSISEFWNAVFNELFPEALVRDAFEDALKDYCIWSEPMGIERWEKVTTLLVQYKEMVAGNTGEALQLSIAERMYQQLIRVIHQCREKQSQDLLRQLSAYQAPINLARATGQKPSAAIYWQTFKGFMLWLSDWLKLYSYEGTFGYPLAPYSSSALKPEIKKHLRHMPETPQPTPAPTPAPLHTSAAARQPKFQQRGSVPKLPEVAPTGKFRTWTWKQRTCPDEGPRLECASEASAEAKDQKCEYLGDWLDLKGLCSYCTKPGHVKADCTKHKENRAKYEASQKKAQLRMMSEGIDDEQEN